MHTRMHARTLAAHPHTLTRIHEHKHARPNSRTLPAHLPIPNTRAGTHKHLRAHAHMRAPHRQARMHAP